MDQTPSVTVSRTSSLNQLFSSSKRRARSKTITDNDRTITQTSVNAHNKKPLSRQKSISEMIRKLSLRTNVNHVHSPSSPRNPKRVVSYTSKAEDYDILRTIGAGATASVYSAIFKPTKSVIAIKTVNLEEVGLDDARLEALRKEIQIMTLSRHQHLLEVYQSFVHASQLYIVTPIMSAGSCHDLLSRCHKVGFEESIVACIIKQVAQGLDYLHHNELIHRDVKSANLLVDFESGIVKLADFGVSNQLLSNLADMPKNTHYFRQHLEPVEQPKKARRSFVGTPCWMAPEILMNQDYDTKVDIWALGITCIELACGRPPFAEYDPMTIFSMVIDDPAPTLYSNGVRYEPSQFIQLFIENCLDKNPMSRMSITEALNHSFLKKASGPHHLQKYLGRRPELNKTSYLMSRAAVNKYNNSDEEEDEDADWDELEFLETTWNFNEESNSNKPPRVETRNYHAAARRRSSQQSMSPITPNDNEDDYFYLNTRLPENYQKRKNINSNDNNDFLITKDYYYY